ncbi:MAG: class I SAM-dependent methyltransferase [Myxococcota bacterium]
MEIRTDIQVFASMGPWAGLNVVDVGCGRGALALALAQRGASVLGVEPNLQTDAPSHPKLRIQSGSAERLPIDDGAVDVVIFNRSLHHIPEALMDASLAEAARILRPMGRLLILEPDPDGQMSQVMEPFHDERAERAAALAAMDRMGQAMTLQEERWVARPYFHRDLDTFRQRMRAAKHMNISEEGLMSPLVAERFAQGEPVGQGRRFTNPVRIRVYTVNP